MVNNARQLTYLKAMGIDVWQQKMRHDNDSQTMIADLQSINLAQLAEQPLFKDILRSLSITFDQVKQTGDKQLDLELFNWQFAHSESVIYQGNTLTTPNIEQLKLSPALKKQLWQLIANIFH
ncbi:DNA polymerase III subunit psi [Thalassotalea ganghwensis]